MATILDKNTNAGNRGSHYTRGSDFLYYVNESPSQIWRQPVNPATMIVQQAAKSLVSGVSNNLNSLGSGDLRWVGGTTKQVQAQNGAKVAKLVGFSALDQITPDALAAVAWDPLASNNVLGGEDGQSTVGNFYAVRIPVTGGDPHYAKVRIFKDSAGTKIEWVAYIIGTRPSVIQTLGADYAAPRDIYVNEFESEIYLTGGGDAGYVIKFQRLVAGPFPQYSDYPVPLYDPSSPVQLINPQQMAVDGSTIYVVAEGGLFLLQPEFGVQVPVVSGISGPVGLLLDKQRSAFTAYISDQTGRVYVVDLSQFNAPMFDSNGDQIAGASAPTAAPSASTQLALGGPSGFLTWADDEHTAFYAAVGGPTGKVQRIDLVSTFVANELTSSDPTLANPWSVQVFSDSSLTVICDAAIYDTERGISLTTDLALGLGLIPFQYINRSTENPASPAPTDGRANTSSAPGYYFSAYPNLAFGGSLSLLVNHQAAWNSNLRFYKLSVANDTTGVSRAITSSFTDLRWNATASPPRFEPVVTGVQSSAFYPVRSPSDLWYNPYLAAIVSTALSDNGHNRLKLDFFDINKAPIAGASYTRLIYVDNTRSSVSLTYLRRGTATVPPAPDAYSVPETCGLTAYDTKDDLIEIDLTAVHPSGIGKYVLTFYRGSTALFTAIGDLTPTPTLLTIKERSPGVPLRVGHLTGNCDIANITVTLSAPSPGVINGYGWVNLNSSTYRTFTLAMPPLTHTNWPVALRTDKESSSTLLMGLPTR
jgi:hypothetical protein